MGYEHGTLPYFVDNTTGQDLELTEGIRSPEGCDHYSKGLPSGKLT